jgi:hypothetical protein
MNKKEHLEISRKHLERVLDGLEGSRELTANLLGVNSSTLRRWLREGKIPRASWEELNSHGFKRRLTALQLFNLKHYGDDSIEGIANSIDVPPEGNTPDKRLSELEEIATEFLVEELERRGWDVTLKKRV